MSKISKILPTSIGGKILALVLTITNITLIVLTVLLFMSDNSIVSNAMVEHTEYDELVPNSQEVKHYKSDLEYDLVVRGVTKNIIKTGVKSTDIATTSNTSSDNNAYIFPDSDTRYLTAEEITAYSAEEIRIGRNEIYARHGRIFNDETLVEHFEATSWYEGMYTAEELDAMGMTIFNGYEIANLELILSLE